MSELITPGETAEARELLAELIRAYDRLAAKRQQLALLCLDGRAQAEDRRALAAADAKLAELKAQIDEGRRLLGEKPGESV